MSFLPRLRTAPLKRNPNHFFKLISALLIISFYLVYSTLYPFHTFTRAPPPPPNPSIQHAKFAGGGYEDKEKADAVKEAMRRTFKGYKEKAWGYDDIMPVSGGWGTSRNGWGAFIVDTSTTMAIMGLWEELKQEVDHVIEYVDFSRPRDGDLVDPFETTIRYLGAMVSLLDMVDAEIIPKDVVPVGEGERLLEKAELLAKKLLPAYRTPTGMPYPRVNFTANLGQGDPEIVYILDPGKKRYKHPAIGLARAGSNILEHRTLARLTGNSDYYSVGTNSWSSLVWSKYSQPWPGMLYAPNDVITGEPVGLQMHWDAGHDSYYEYLLKAAILSPHDTHSSTYLNRWTSAAMSLRKQLSSRSTPTKSHPSQHLYIGKQDGPYYLNEMSHLACFAPGNLIYGGRFTNNPTLLTFGKALLEGCRHIYASSPLGIGPEIWNWLPYPDKLLEESNRNATFLPQTKLQKKQLEERGFWAEDPQFKLRPEYVESLFYAWRITGETRYREWAWEAFQAIEKHCRTAYGYSGIRDVMIEQPVGKKHGPQETEVEEKQEEEARVKVVLSDESESFWGAETLKYLWLIFADVSVGSLDSWVYSTEGHVFRMIE